MQILISNTAYHELIQTLFSPLEIFVYLLGNFDRNIYYVWKTEVSTIGEIDKIPEQDIFATLKDSVTRPDLLGFFHSHPNDGSQISKLSASDTKYFQTINSIWTSLLKKPFSTLLGIGSMSSSMNVLLFDIKFFYLENTGLPVEITANVVF
jgi:hypothetical protein